MGEIKNAPNSKVQLRNMSAAFLTIRTLHHPAEDKKFKYPLAAQTLRSKTRILTDADNYIEAHEIQQRATL